MAEKLPTMTDLAMNFMGFRVDLDGVASQTLVTAAVPTGMSPRSHIAMMVHLVELDWKFAFDEDAQLMIALSTRAGLSTQPDPNDDGCLVSFRHEVQVVTEGAYAHDKPIVRGWLPPVALAAPQLNLYARTSSHVASVAGEGVFGRIGFTTVPLTPAMYQEIAETWGW